MALVLPGDPLPTPSTSALTLGPGALSTAARAAGAPGGTAQEHIVASKMGVAHTSTKRRKNGGEVGSVYVDARARRYVPAPGESVLGTVIARFAGGFRVDIGAAHMAALDALAFEGATRRSAPRLEIGTLVYARVALASRDMEPELECVDPATGKSQGYGEIKGGLLVASSVHFCRRLITPRSPLRHLTLPFPYELSIGANARIHIAASSVARVICVKRFLEDLEAGRIRGAGGAAGGGFKREEGEGEEQAGGDVEQRDVDEWIKRYGGMLA